MGEVAWGIDAMTDAGFDLDDEAVLSAVRNGPRTAHQMYKGALYTYRVLYVTKQVGPGTGTSQQQYAEQLGISPAYVTMLRRLGRALVIHQIPYGSPCGEHSPPRLTAERGALLDSNGPIDLDRLRQLVANNRRAAPPKAAAAEGRQFEEAQSGIRVVSEAARTLQVPS